MNTIKGFFTILKNGIKKFDFVYNVQAIAS